MIDDIEHMKERAYSNIQIDDRCLILENYLELKLLFMTLCIGLITYRIMLFSNPPPSPPV
jgi:hypothetical protein